MVIMLICMMQAVLVSAAHIRVLCLRNAIGVQNATKCVNHAGLKAAKLNNDQIMSVRLLAERTYCDSTYIQIVSA